MDEKTTRFIQNVASMRSAQRDYFQLIAKAKKTRLPADFAAANNKLKQSKALEIEVDRLVPIFLATPVTNVSNPDDANH